jgi:hypothetical protein
VAPLVAPTDEEGVMADAARALAAAQGASRPADPGGRRA